MSGNSADSDLQTAPIVSAFAAGRFGSPPSTWVGIVELIALPFGGIGTAPGVLLGLFLVIAVFGVLAAVGRRRRDRAKRAA